MIFTESYRECMQTVCDLSISTSERISYLYQARARCKLKILKFAIPDIYCVMATTPELFSFVWCMCVRAKTS